MAVSLKVAWHDHLVTISSTITILYKCESYIKMASYSYLNKESCIILCVCDIILCVLHLLIRVLSIAVQGFRSHFGVYSMEQNYQN